MSADDKRNTLIVELNKHSNISIKQLQRKYNTGNVNSLVGMAAICHFLYTKNIRSKSELFEMSDDDQRNTLIVELNKKLGKTIRELQGMGDLQLVACGADASFPLREGSDVISKVLAVHWDLQSAIIVERTPEVLAEHTYDNRRSDHILKETFRYCKTIEKQTRFEHTQSLHFSGTATFSFKAPIPVITENNASFSVTAGYDTTWTSAETKTITQTFEKTTDVEIQPRSYIRRKSILTIGKMNVPYTMDVETESGKKMTINGVWHGVSLINIKEIQENIQD